MAARAARAMVINDPQTTLRLINKALLVVAEQGLYAFGLFLATRKDDAEQQAVQQVHQALQRLLQESELQMGDPQSAIPDYYRALAETTSGESDVAALQRLLLTHQLIETALTYGRYHARAAQRA